MRKTVVEITITRNGGIVNPEELAELLERVEGVIENEDYTGVVIISGRLPVWCYAALVHLLHPAKAIATYDPRLGGSVIVATHTSEFQIGQVVVIEDANKKVIEF